MKMKIKTYKEVYYLIPISLIDRFESLCCSIDDYETEANRDYDNAVLHYMFNQHIIRDFENLDIVDPDESAYTIKVDYSKISMLYSCNNGFCSCGGHKSLMGCVDRLFTISDMDFNRKIILDLSNAIK